MDLAQYQHFNKVIGRSRNLTSADVKDLPVGTLLVGSVLNNPSNTVHVYINKKRELCLTHYGNDYTEIEVQHDVVDIALALSEIYVVPDLSSYVFLNMVHELNFGINLKRYSSIKSDFDFKAATVKGINDNRDLIEKMNLINKFFMQYTASRGNPTPSGITHNLISHCWEILGFLLSDNDFTIETLTEHLNSIYPNLSRHTHKHFDLVPVEYHYSNSKSYIRIQNNISAMLNELVVRLQAACKK